MALLHKKQSEIPQDAVRLNEKQALLYFMKLVEGWPDKWDMSVSSNDSTLKSQISLNIILISVGL